MKETTMTWDVITLLAVMGCGGIVFIWMLVRKGLRHAFRFVFGGLAGYGQYAAGRTMAIYDQRRSSTVTPRKSTARFVVGTAFGLAKLMTSHDQDENDNFGFYYESDFGPSEHQFADYSRSDHPRH